MIEIAAEGH